MPPKIILMKLNLLRLVFASDRIRVGVISGVIRALMT